VGMVLFVSSRRKSCNAGEVFGADRVRLANLAYPKYAISVLIWPLKGKKEGLQR